MEGIFDLFNLTKIFSINYLILSVRYFILAGIAYFFFWVWKRSSFQVFRIQEKFPDKSKIISEIKYSLITFLIFASVGTTLFIARKMGYTLIYTDITDYGWGYFFLSIVLAIVIHDAYFYWAHRFMHHKWLFKKVHAVHHYSVNPSPWAAFSFHPLEAVLEAGILPMLVFILPMHPGAIISFLFFMTILNVLGHLGYELYPKNFVRSRWTNWNNTSFHHNQHHQKFNCNYGLYFNWWDKMMGTNHPSYQEEFESLTETRDQKRQESTGFPARTPMNSLHS
jgi:Delta7-sterol 5-desaturase